jgi:transposase InsO family protein
MSEEEAAATVDNDGIDRQLANIYYAAGDPGSYGGAERLLTRARDVGIGGNALTKRRVQAFLRNQQAYTLHKPVRKRFARNPTYVQQRDQQWQADLADVHQLADDNDGHHFLLTCIDILSKFAWVVPVKSKDAQHMVVAMRKLLKQAHPRKPKRLQTDKGTEFFNSSVGALLREHKIEHFASESDQKAAVVERFNRTLKSRMWTYFSANKTKRYVNVLQDIVYAYNHTEHRSIRMRPVDVDNEQAEQAAYKRLYYDKDAKVKHKKVDIAPDASVRVTRWKGEFEKGYLPNWGREHFKVKEAIGDAPRAVYKLEDVEGEPIKGVWYREEVQPIKRNIYEVESLLAERQANRRAPKEVLVKWLGLPAKFNRWVLKSDLPKYQRTTAEQCRGK